MRHEALGLSLIRRSLIRRMGGALVPNLAGARLHGSESLLLLPWAWLSAPREAGSPFMQHLLIVFVRTPFAGDFCTLPPATALRCSGGTSIEFYRTSTP